MQAELDYHRLYASILEQQMSQLHVSGESDETDDDSNPPSPLPGANPPPPLPGVNPPPPGGLLQAVAPMSFNFTLPLSGENCQCIRCLQMSPRTGILEHLNQVCTTVKGITVQRCVATMKPSNVETHTIINFKCEAQPGEKPFSCPKCGVDYKGLKTHLNTCAKDFPFTKVK
jgi:hypothetical protein